MVTLADNADLTELTVSRYDLGGAQVLELCGECDLATNELLTSGLVDAVAQRPAALIVDLTRVGFCDAAGVGQLLVLSQRTPVVVVGAVGVVRRLFDLLDPQQHLPRCPTIDDALSRVP